MLRLHPLERGLDAYRAIRSGSDLSQADQSPQPGGVLAISLRNGPAEPARGIHPVSLAEVETLVREHGAFVERKAASDDRLGRAEIHWTHIALRLPDDGTGALPLLRHVILNDDKSSTYKLGPAAHSVPYCRRRRWFSP